jgi:hypothetical protein
MIPLQTCEKIRELLLANQHSVRTIARQMHVSPATVGRIARRRHWPSKVTPEQLLTAPIRCPGCGGQIEVLPCRLCRARQVAEKLRADRRGRPSYGR